jgi:hypothetical protein
MDFSINTDFENRCLNIVKDKILSLSEGINGKIFLFGPIYMRPQKKLLNFIMLMEQANNFTVNLNLIWE